MFQVVVRSREGRILRGDAWYTRYVWVTWTMEKTLEAACKIAGEIGGRVVRVGERFVHYSYPGLADEVWF
jgi:hypothetical protein